MSKELLQTVDVLLELGVITPARQTYHTTDLSIFKIMPKGNREIVPTHVNELERRFRRNILDVVIMVNERYEIIDGQHRYTALLRINKERVEAGLEPIAIEFIISKGYGVKECMELNGKSKNWNNSNIVRSKCSIGDKNYIHYRDFSNKYNLPHKETLAVLSGEKYSMKTCSDFKNGQFVVDSVSEAHKNAQMIRDIIDTGVVPIGRCEQGLGVYCSAILKIIHMDGYNHEEMVKKCGQFIKKNEVLPKYGNVVEPLLELEEIYNYHRRGERFNFMSEREKNRHYLKEARKKK
jgi:hypothetical protein